MKWKKWSEMRSAVGENWKFNQQNKLKMCVTKPYIIVCIAYTIFVLLYKYILFTEFTKCIYYIYNNFIYGEMNTCVCVLMLVFVQFMCSISF